MSVMKKVTRSKSLPVTGLVSSSLDVHKMVVTGKETLKSHPRHPHDELLLGEISTSLDVELEGASQEVLDEEDGEEEELRHKRSIAFWSSFMPEDYGKESDNDDEEEEDERESDNKEDEKKEEEEGEGEEEERNEEMGLAGNFEQFDFEGLICDEGDEERGSTPPLDNVFSRSEDPQPQKEETSGKKKTKKTPHPI